jgi:transposase
MYSIHGSLRVRRIFSGETPGNAKRFRVFLVKQYVLRYAEAHLKNLQIQGAEHF